MASRSTPRPALKASAASSTSGGRKNLGVRLDEGERAFLAHVAPGATPSEAVRTALAQLRTFLAVPASVPDTLEQLRPLFAPVFDALNGQGQAPRSVVGEEVAREALQVLAQLRYAALTLPTDAARETARQAMERLAVEGGFTLTDGLLRQTLPQTASSLEPSVVRERFRKSKALMVATVAAVAKDEPPRSRTGD